MPDLFGAWTQRLMFDVAPSSAAEGCTRIVSILASRGGRFVSAEADMTEVALGSAVLMRALGLVLPPAKFPVLVRVAPMPTTKPEIVAVDVLSDPGFYLIPVRSIFAWLFLRAGRHILKVIQAETGYPLIASSHLPGAESTRSEAAAEVILQRFLEGVSREAGGDDRLLLAAVSASDALKSQDLGKAISLTRQIVATIRGRPREDGIRHLVERGIDSCLDDLDERKAACPSNTP